MIARQCRRVTFAPLTAAGSTTWRALMAGPPGKGPGKGSPTMLKKVIPITREESHYLEPGSDAVKRKNG